MNKKETDEQSLTALHHADIQTQQQHYLRQATSDNTRRAYRSAVRQFERWSGFLPTDEATMVRYLLAKAKVINPRTLTLHLTALSNWHRYQHLPDPTDTPLVRKTLQGIRRDHGVPKRRAKALRLEDVITLVELLAKRDDLKSIRDNAIIQVSYFGAFRRSELIALSIDDLTFEPEGLLINIRRSKTDQTGQGKVKALPYGKTGLLCPVKAMKQWLEAAKIEKGIIFRAINRWGQLQDNKLHGASINLILKELGKQCGFDFTGELSSHSLRRGLATSAARQGASFDSIKRQGGWRNDATVREYIEEGQLFEDNAAEFLLQDSTQSQ